jgi:membrane protein DedA with SNARE-associated domain
MLALALALGTFVSEDLACVAAAVLIQRGDLSAVTAVAACTTGIVLGDCGLWLLGRLAHRTARAWPWLAARLSAHRADGVRVALERHAGAAIVASRFVPGTRLPLYLTAGWIRLSPLVFAGWTLVAALLWTPAFILTTAGAGQVVSMQLALPGWSGAVAGLLALGLVASARSRLAPDIRRRVVARIARWRRWEFWPMWLFYAPVAAWVALLSVRYRGLTTMTAANPGIPDGGTVGESKYGILARLPADCTIPAELVPEAREASARLGTALDAIARRGWRYPLVLKPDVGQRGAGVRLIRSADGVADYLSRTHRAVLIQPYHEGPFEAGVFYYRFPGVRRGRILSITDKHFPVLIGDGRSTVEALIRAHPRYRLQASLFLRRHCAAARRVLGRDERFPLALAGNHAQGTLFRDGSHLATPALERRIDDIARSYPGFFIGRFDIRYRDVEAFKAGRDLAIVELNGATAESTDIYDPDHSLWHAYRRLFRQWALVFAIGAENRARGAGVTSARRMLDLLRGHLSLPTPSIAD